MSINDVTARLLICEHKYKSLPDEIYTLGRQTIEPSQLRLTQIFAEEGVRPSRFVEAYDTTTTGAEQIRRRERRHLLSDKSFFSLFGVKLIHAIDHSDFEGADTILDIGSALDGTYSETMDFIFDGSVMDNVFDPPQAMRNIARLLRPGGRYFGANHCSSISYAYLTFNPYWFFDFFALNGFKDVRVYVFEYDSHWDTHIYYLDPALYDRDVIGYQSSGGLAGVVVIAERSETSTWSRTPSQGIYRLEQEWELFNRNLKQIVQSKRPLFATRPHHDRDFEDSPPQAYSPVKSREFRHVGTLMTPNVNELPIALPGCDINPTATFQGYNWGEIQFHDEISWRYLSTDDCGSHVEAFLSPEWDYLLYLFIHTADSHETLSSLIVEVNGQVPIDARIEWRDHTPVYSGRVPAALCKMEPDGHLLIVLRLTPRLDTEDKRRLAISKISLERVGPREPEKGDRDLPGARDDATDRRRT